MRYLGLVFFLGFSCSTSLHSFIYFDCNLFSFHQGKSRRPKDRLRLLREFQVLTSIPPSRFLQQCHWSFESPSTVFFVTDYLGGGDLFFHLEQLTLQNREGFCEPQVMVAVGVVIVGTYKTLEESCFFENKSHRNPPHPTDSYHFPTLSSSADFGRKLLTPPAPIEFTFKCTHCQHNHPFFFLKQPILPGALDLGRGCAGLETFARPRIHSPRHQSGEHHADLTRPCSAH